MTEAVEHRPSVDARGVYKNQNGNFDIQNPRDLVTAGIWVSEDAIRATWGDAGITEYRDATKSSTADKPADTRRIEHTAAGGRLNRFERGYSESDLPANDDYELDLWVASFTDGRIQ